MYSMHIVMLPCRHDDCIHSYRSLTGVGRSGRGWERFELEVEKGTKGSAS